MNLFKNIKLIVSISLIFNVFLVFMILGFWYQNRLLEDKYDFLLNKVEKNLAINNMNNRQNQGNFSQGESGISQDIDKEFEKQENMMNNVQNLFDSKNSGGNQNTYITGNANMNYSSSFFINGKQLSYNLSQNEKNVSGQIISQDKDLLDKISKKLNELKIKTSISDGKVDLNAQNVNINSIINTINTFVNSLNTGKIKNNTIQQKTNTNQNPNNDSGNGRAF